MCKGCTSQKELDICNAMSESYQINYEPPEYRKKLGNNTFQEVLFLKKKLNSLQRILLKLILINN